MEWTDLHVGKGWPDYGFIYCVFKLVLIEYLLSTMCCSEQLGYFNEQKQTKIPDLEKLTF